LIRTNSDWLLHLTKDQNSRLRRACRCCGFGSVPATSAATTSREAIQCLWRYDMDTARIT
jgi:hypothetical protein